MGDQTVPERDIFGATSGGWLTGIARTVTVPRAGDGFDLSPVLRQISATGGRPATGVKLVVVYYGSLENMPGGYSLGMLGRHARQAVKDLCALTRTPTDRAVVGFADHYGLLYGPTGSKYIERGPDSDRYYYLDWCERTGRLDDAAFFQWGGGERAWIEERWRVSAGLPPERWPAVAFEPLSLFIWAGQCLEQLRREAVGGGLSPEMRGWLNRQLARLHLHYADQPGRLSIRAETLLSFLASQALLNPDGTHSDLGRCEDCGRMLPYDRHGNLRFCSTQCRERAKKRRQRRRIRRGDVATPVADRVAEGPDHGGR
jgi:hypothetical protein